MAKWVNRDHFMISLTHGHRHISASQLTLPDLFLKLHLLVKSNTAKPDATTNLSFAFTKQIIAASNPALCCVIQAHILCHPNCHPFEMSSINTAVPQYRKSISTHRRESMLVSSERMRTLLKQVTVSLDKLVYGFDDMKNLHKGKVSVCIVVDACNE